MNKMNLSFPNFTGSKCVDELDIYMKYLGYFSFSFMSCHPLNDHLIKLGVCWENN